jgi:hypothetical protein
VGSLRRAPTGTPGIAQTTSSASTARRPPAVSLLNNLPDHRQLSTLYPRNEQQVRRKHNCWKLLHLANTNRGKNNTKKQRTRAQDWEAVPQRTCVMALLALFLSNRPGRRARGLRRAPRLIAIERASQCVGAGVVCVGLGCFFLLFPLRLPKHRHSHFRALFFPTPPPPVALLHHLFPASVTLLSLPTLTLQSFPSQSLFFFAREKSLSVCANSTPSLLHRRLENFCYIGYRNCLHSFGFPHPSSPLLLSCPVTHWLSVLCFGYSTCASQHPKRTKSSSLITRPVSPCSLPDQRRVQSSVKPIPILSLFCFAARDLLSQSRQHSPVSSHPRSVNTLDYRADPACVSRADYL